MIVFKSCNSGEGSKGAGIVVTDDLSEYREQWGACEQNAFNHVAQLYIENPMLIQNVRLYGVVLWPKPHTDQKI